MWVIEISRHVFGLDSCLGIVCNQGLYIAHFCRARSNMKHSEYLMKPQFLSRWGWSKSAVSQPSIALSGSAPSCAFVPSLTPRLIPTQPHEKLVWGAETNYIKLKKSFRSIQLVQISCHDLTNSSKKRKGGNIKLGPEGMEESEQLWFRLAYAA